MREAGAGPPQSQGQTCGGSADPRRGPLKQGLRCSAPQRVPVRSCSVQTVQRPYQKVIPCCVY